MFRSYAVLNVWLPKYCSEVNKKGKKRFYNYEFIHIYFKAYANYIEPALKEITEQYIMRDVEI